jgi:hypothetical protein
MAKLVMVVSVLLILSGCKDTVIVEDNGPDRHERDQAMEDCVGEYIIRNASFNIRLACTQAIYGED